MYKIINPNYKTNNEVEREKLSQVINEFINGLPKNIKSFSFDEIRQKVESLNISDSNGAAIDSNYLTDEMIISIANSLDIKVDMSNE